MHSNPCIHTLGTQLLHVAATCQVFDAKTQQLVGIFYMDLHPRPGKYGHAAMFPLQPGSFFPGSGTKRTGGRSVPVGALVCNFPKPNGNQAATLPHSDVVTYFHEFGHVMHKLCGHTNLSLFEGTNVQTDFVEAPSQMLENWCWETDVLQKMSGHVNNTKQPIPKELAVQLAKSQLANAGTKEVSMMRADWCGLPSSQVITLLCVSL